MKARLLLVRDGLEGAIPSMAHVLRDAGLSVSTVSGLEMSEARSADVVMLRIRDRDPAATCWDLHRQGYRSVVAVTLAPTSEECIRLLNAGADYYLDAWMPADAAGKGAQRKRVAAVVRDERPVGFATRREQVGGRQLHSERSAGETKSRAG